MTEEKNNTLDNGYQTVNEVFSQATPFFIPRFQRGYRWTKENVEQLIEDIFEGKWLDEDLFSCDTMVFEDELLSKKKQLYLFKDRKIVAISPYCIQPLAICEDEIKTEEGKENVFSVIDGQQRLTTLLIVISALRSFSKRKDKWPRITIKYESRTDSAGYLDRIYEDAADIVGQKEKSLDFQYMYNSFVAAKEFFGYKLNHIDEDDYREKYIIYLREIILHNTRFIWYKFDSNESSPHTIFNNFNSGKTALTDSELIKAVFMDGDNYGSEDIEDKRIVISEKWDEIENELHDEDFWTFVPHAGQYNTESKIYDTRIDLIFEYLVSRKWEEFRERGILKGNEGQENKKPEKEYHTYLEAKRASSQDYYLYDLVNRWIEKEIEMAKENTSDSEEFRSTKAQIMGKCWAEVRNIYLELRELYKEDLISGNENQIYNMAGLYIRLRNIRTSTLDQGEKKEGPVNFEKQEEIAFQIYEKLVTEVINAARSQRKKRLKELIYEELGYEGICSGKLKEDVSRKDKIEYAVKRINYDEDEGNENTPVIKTLLAYNIALLNQSSGFGERFNFRALAKQNFQKEHIFACSMKDKNKKVEETFIAERWERRKKALELLVKEDSAHVKYVKYITGYKTKMDNPNLEDEGDKARTYKYEKEDELIILDEEQESSVDGFLNHVGLDFSHRDERDSKKPYARMAKALKLRKLSKEKLAELNAVVKLEDIKTLDYEDEAGKMKLYLVLMEVKNRFNKKSCFNHSELQEGLKKEIEKCIREQEKEKKFSVNFKGIKAETKAETDNLSGIRENLESNWYANYEASVCRKFFKDDRMTDIKPFDEIAQETFKDLKDILTAMKEALQYALDVFFEKDFVDYLKDNSLGNMTLLTAGAKKTVENQASKSKTNDEKNQNSIVGDEPFYQKRDEIIKFSKEGKFVPIGTVLVFSGAFEELSEASDYWLHNCRMKYLENMIAALQKFLC